MTKKHTKFLSLLIALIMVFTLVSCGKKEEAKETTEKATEATEETTEEATEATEEAEAATGEATEAKTIKTEKLSLIHEPEFGGAYITMTIDDFNNMGFQYGDSLDITFSNGYKMTDVPYYSGYFAPTGSQFLVGYPGYDYIKAVISNGEDLWLDIIIEPNVY